MSSRREDHEPARDEPRVLAGFEHAREPVDAGVGIRAADRLDERGDDVVVLVVAVVDRLRSASAASASSSAMRPVARSTASACATSSTVRRWRASPSLLSTRCSSASSSISVASSPRPRSLVGERALRELAQIVVGERLEPEQRAAREQRAGEREERVLGGRADEHEQTLLDEREQHVLLRAGEAVHLVEEEDRALAAFAEPGPGPLGDLAHVLHARAHRARASRTPWR